MRILSRNESRFCAATATLLGASVAAMTAAHAGAFAVREQSAYYQGMSFAGSGTGDTLSSMYWNSAAAASVDGFNSESDVAVVIPDSEITANGGAFRFLGRDSDQISDVTVIPTSYYNYQLDDRWYLGLAMNSSFGFKTKPDNVPWAGTPLALTSDLFSVNVNPTIAYKLRPDLTVGVGVQVEYLDVRLTRLPAPVPGDIGRRAELNDVGVGGTAGLNWTPLPGTSFGVGYRSQVDFELDGFLHNAFNNGIDNHARADLTLPDMVTVGFRQALSPRLDLLLGYEWTNWSMLDTIPVRAQNSPTEFLRLEYDDGQFVSGGLEYDYTPATTLRIGLAWEKSPISDHERNVLLPDADRIWLSVGGSYRYSEKVSFDIGYSHIFVDDAPICREAPVGGPCNTATRLDDLIRADADTSIDIVSASYTYRWGVKQVLEPMK
ncbi:MULTISPECIES: outer membrane protein transport protein [Rhodomicrobium]|uniref:OmpP1/FadL family transporter n=1 Tax=Rhodomicrobium TaxID=1068 RepID=UPI00148238E3|nr:MULTISPECIES: outer membrane protein transport protein [Rhodomicrobium]